ncbi:hypothetical protein M5K25_004665 [Dendrobium thyrsiflorum]|uniref:Uncharacterized protein n=1 Tax=Dendrobium thyrsiflorum TaxID=117978 RepID=A0ABD0VFQ8_DENTH
MWSNQNRNCITAVLTGSNSNYSDGINSIIQHFQNVYNSTGNINPDTSPFPTGETLPSHLRFNFNAVCAVTLSKRISRAIFLKITRWNNGELLKENLNLKHC